MEGKSFQDICNMYAVCFDLLYNGECCFSGMDPPYEAWPLVRVKIVFGKIESSWLVLQLLVALTSLTLLILSNLDKLKQGGKERCQ
uniref:Uncharacterized protein n=1 Tax=Torque teno Leptonychotes weddellii virus-1 TaxID=2012676 RepID=A0A1Z2RV85_9VIRU|nr:hypothetical protein [Torque teno Leptonychotes weddellii virus 1]ASA48512.1 hypothetical protein [Torque teno Leptonychotes weddellii virus 1]WCS65602.1 hypothetical protein [Torque teno Leptonychotes weddellii virus 1]WCS65654.1 hypothetical protein [Torque teno Leptonychotes weddellii virus 1]WCS65722.1 hypothetical protein [Torque teno Leptonychotes weddellii virus 1]